MTDSQSPFDLAIAYWSFGWLPSDRLPGLAVEALEQGMECPALIQLVAAESVGNPDLHRLFTRVLSELGKSPLSKPDAGWMIARDYARRICSREIIPIEGARAICRVSLECEE